MVIRLKEGKYNILWPINILKYCLPLICVTFFGQIFIIIISTFACKNGKSYFDSTMNCRKGSLYYICVPTTIVVILLQIMMSYITVSMYYHADFLCEKNGVLKKRTSTPDIIFLFCKIIIVIIFIFDKEKESEHWGILFVLCLVTGFNAYTTLYFQYYDNIVIKRFNHFFSLFLFWGFFCLFIGNIFKTWEFGGGLYLFILGLILIFIYCIFYAKTYIEFLHINFYEINSSYKYINYILSYLDFIRKRNISRDNSMILSSFIKKVEENCTNKKCVLKRYLDSLSRGFDSNFLLLQFAQNLFKIALRKFPRNVTLKLHYTIFLLTQINQKKNAQKELITIKPHLIFLNDNFNLYRCKKFIEEYSSISKKENEEGIESNDIIQEMEYKNNAKEFRRLLSKSSSLYYDFWSSLYSSHLQGIEDFKKLNDIGAELNKIIENIEIVFGKLREIKNNDLVIVKLYESYAKNILNDNEKYEKYCNISMNLITDNKIENKEKDYTNFDLKILNENDENKYLIISANDENKGTIINMSLNACLTFGYHKNEIIGKNMNILIPEIYHKIHDKAFNDITEKTKTDFFENLSNKIIYKPESIEFSAFSRNKSKYLIPLDFKLFFVQTEESELVYVVDITDKEINDSDLNEDNDNENDKNQICCVLTDNNLIIQTFTSNCVEMLGLNSNIINSNYDITSFIKQFNEDLQTIITSNKEFSGFEATEIRSNDNSFEINNSNNINDKSLENKLKYKRKLLRLKYSVPRKIVWNIIKNDKSEEILQNDIYKSQLSLFGSKENKNLNLNEIVIKNDCIQKKFYMEVKGAYISGKHIGYYFYFKKIKLPNDIGKIKTIKESPLASSNSRKTNVKFCLLDDNSARNYKIPNDDDNEDSSINKNNISRLSNASPEIHFKKKFEFGSESPLRKHVSSKVIYDDPEKFDVINEYLIPKCNFNFFLDLNTMSYKPSTNLNSCKELFEILRNQTFEKLNILKKAKKNEEKEDSSILSENQNSSQGDVNNTSEDSSDSYISSSPSNSSSIKSNRNDNNNFQRNNKKKGSIIENNALNIKSTNIKKNNKKPVFLETSNNNNSHKSINNYKDEYYRVNISKIKFMLYDFNQEMVITSNKKEKKSQVETIIEDYKSRQHINISEDENFKNISFEKYTKDSKSKRNKKKIEKFSQKNLVNENENKNIFDKEKEFEKDIAYALAKQDEQKSITHFYIVSFLFLIFLLLMGIFEIKFIVNEYCYLKENMNLIIDAINLKYYTNYAIYFLRENTLFSMINEITDGIYNIPNENELNYQLFIIDSLEIIFIDCNSIIETIKASNLEFCGTSKYILTEKEFEIEILYKNSIKKIKSSLYVSMIQVYSAFCNLISKDDYIYIDDNNLFNFIHNSYNNLGNALNTQIELFVNELIIKEKNIIIDIIINIVSFLVLHLILYFLICHSYSLIVKRKASYIEVFYGIGLSLIKSSIRKCEIFLNKINQSSEDSKNKEIDDDENSYISSTHMNFNNLFMENNFGKKNMNKQAKIIKKKKKLGNDKKSIRFKIIYQIYLIISFLYLALVYITFLLLTKKYIYSGNYLMHMQNYHNNVLELFNGFREYLFDENTIVYGFPAYEYLIEKEKNIYLHNTEDINYLTIVSERIEGLYNLYLEIQREGLCGSYKSFFTSKEGCELFIGGENGILSLGFHILINSFVEETRNARNLMRNLLNEKVLVGNLSKYINMRDNDTTYGLDKNKSLIFRMKVFNMEQVHYRLNIIFLNIIMQYIDKERNITLVSVDKSVTDIHLKYIILIVSYIVIVLVIFLFYWMPMIKKMDIEIYKTKNMLSIIPVQILASQPNIKQLLNISIKND